MSDNCFVEEDIDKAEDSLVIILGDETSDEIDDIEGDELFGIVVLLDLVDLGLLPDFLEDLVLDCEGGGGGRFILLSIEVSTVNSMLNELARLKD